MQFLYQAQSETKFTFTNRIEHFDLSGMSLTIYDLMQVIFTMVMIQQNR